jgi:hypothetical protein
MILSSAVIPAKAGIPLLPFTRLRQGSWIPAFAGMTEVDRG